MKDNMAEKVYCINCEHHETENGFYRCGHPENTYIDVNKDHPIRIIKLRAHKEDPYVLNDKNNCGWFT